MHYECVHARFLFNNGKSQYTVEFAYSLATWYIFEGDNVTGCLWYKKVKIAAIRSPTRSAAMDILDEFLQASQAGEEKGGPKP